MCSIASHTLNNFFFRRSFLNRFVSHYLRSMATDVASAVKIDTELSVDVNNKRLIVEPVENGTSKKQKTEELSTSRKRKKYAMLMSYVGAKYMGMQRNPGCNTIEEQLLIALRKADLIEDKMFDEAQLMHFQRAARTDKGVSAAKQIVSLKLPAVVSKEEINQHLPDDIRVLGIERATKSFNSKKYCTARTYMYIIPTYVFVPGDEPFLDENSYTIQGKPYREFRITPDVIEKINEVGKLFLGTRNCHNVTSRILPTDPRALRVIYNFSCTSTFIAKDHEFALLTIKGQSFLLHQIRKMVCLLIGAMRNVITKEDILSVLSREKYRVGQAPGLGLILRNLHYDGYNKKYGTDGIHKPLIWDDCEADVETFLNDFIIKHIIDTESSDQHAFKWLQSKHFQIQKDEQREETSLEKEEDSEQSESFDPSDPKDEEALET